MKLVLNIAIGTLHDLRRAWWQLALTDLFLRIAGAVMLSPMLALLLRVFLSRWGTPAVMDTDLLQFFLRPLGLAALLVVGAVSLAILFAESSLSAFAGRRFTSFWRGGSLPQPHLRLSGCSLLTFLGFSSAGSGGGEGSRLPARKDRAYGFIYAPLWPFSPVRDWPC